jgi:hypothetical protein
LDINLDKCVFFSVRCVDFLSKSSALLREKKIKKWKEKPIDQQFIYILKPRDFPKIFSWQILGHPSMLSPPYWSTMASPTLQCSKY